MCDGRTARTLMQSVARKESGCGLDHTDQSDCLANHDVILCGLGDVAVVVVVPFPCLLVLTVGSVWGEGESEFEPRNRQ